MNFPAYWVKVSQRGKTLEGKSITIRVYGWSAISVNDAERHGNERAKKILNHGISSKRRDAHIFGKKKRTNRLLSDYEYGNTPFREEVLDSLHAEGKEIAVISRNRYGSTILNTANVMFVDIDFPAQLSELHQINRGNTQPIGIWEAIMLTISKKRRDQRDLAIQSATIKSVAAWTESNPEKSFRLYRTHSGLRLILTDRKYNPNSDESKALLTELRSAPLYCALTERQECYRARLSPKPWRCGLTRPPSQYPWDDDRSERLYSQWLRTYESKSKNFTTCELIEVYESPEFQRIDEIQRVIDFHDRLTLANNLPLA